MRTALLLLLATSLPGWGYWNYDPAAPPTGGPHRRINALAWHLFLTTQISESERPDPLLQRYRLKESELRPLTGETYTQWGAWHNDVATGETALSVPLWIAEGGYTADEPELYMSLRHFYDPTRPEGRRYLTDIPFIAQFREQLRQHWRSDVAVNNPEVDARTHALSAPNNRHSWNQGLVAIRESLGPGDLTQAQRDKLAAQGWRALGETMHLLADMTVPAHVRDDGHPGKTPAGTLRPDPYEDWILAPEVDAAYATIPRTSGWQRLDPFAAMDDEAGSAITGSDSPLALFHAVARYVNRRFLSADTISGTDHLGNPVAPVTGTAYPSPLLGRDCVWDEGAGTYNTTLKRREPVMMVRETWQRNTWSSWAHAIGLNLAGGKLTFATSRDCAVSQSLVLVPFAVTACMKLIDWYLPRWDITITSIDATAPDKPLVGKVTHKPAGAWTQPIEVTLAKNATIALYLDGVPQATRDYTLKVERGVLSGTLGGVDNLAEARRIWVEMDLAGITVASADFSPQGLVSVRVCKPKDQVEIGAQNPFGTLAGEPIPDAPVTCTYTHRGQPATLRARTDRTGLARFSVPLNVEVTIGAQGEEQQVTCTPDKPRRSVAFGWQGHEVTPHGAEARTDNPLLTGEEGFER